MLGVPVGQRAYILEFLEKKSREQTVLFQRIPWVNDPQAAWLLLMMCALTRANFWLRAVQPELTEAFATRHDVNVWNCLRTILGTGSDVFTGVVKSGAFCWWIGVGHFPLRLGCCPLGELG